MRFSKKIIVLMFITVFIFVIAMTAIFCVKGAVPDVLIDNFFGFFGIEGGALAIIKVGETVAERLDTRKGEKEKSAKKADKKGVKRTKKEGNL